MSTRPLSIRIGAAMLLSVAVALACGPFLGIEVLQNRSNTLLAPPTVSFVEELRSLVPKPTGNLPLVESSEIDRAAVEAKQVSEGLYSLGTDLPPAARLYTAAADQFHTGNLEAARQTFLTVADMPEAKRLGRDLWAHYNLGRIAVAQNDHETATAEFERVRDLVRHGAPDPLGLAVASFGEQARSAWNASLTAEAVTLYAQQASYRSENAANSLVLTATRIFKDPKRLDDAVKDATARRLLFLDGCNNNSRVFFVGSTSEFGSAPVGKLVAALERQGIQQAEGAGLLASAAYTAARFDVAAKFASMEDVPIAKLVSAKLALRRGDRVSALKFYDAALRQFPRGDSNIITASAELAVVHTSRSEYAQALDLLMAATAAHLDPIGGASWFEYADYWGDAAYLAERVLTLKELQRYVDGLGRASSEMALLRSRLHSVLARRLMREGRRSDALAYFDDKTTRAAATEYSQQLDRAAHWWWPSSVRAEAWFRAATLARQKGMEILGFEKEPDFAIWDGSYESTITTAKADQLYITADERQRLATSKPLRPVRFQYRLTAVDLATKAADHLPARSQAYAAVLCTATQWVINRQPDIAEQLYRRYLKQGAHVPWGRTFGRSCPQPDFKEASWWMVRSPESRRLRMHVRAHPFLSGIASFAFLALVSAAIYLLIARRRVQGKPLP